ncbi:3-oxo-tetronate kinase [Leifsonia sp. C5G2]|uniref:3-oxo-tetronate kinase n=1 Tax=Leifsonia sp. C5G2 TaxID=2735269 RepID=UPI0015852B2A|nr:3-oxo-tetronate kinase [Leifsonia sp. C5G2]NUU08507.1 four-carbon acid sugar kinase family protein [Leifsonia sp. C5G2]
MRLGAVADDVTGACDLAGRVAEAGLPATVLLGTPSEAPEAFPADGAGCAVVALKIRTAPVAEAVAAATDAARLLHAAGATQLYQKYCSTFDSTARGNIGPVADALAGVAAADGTAVTVGTPATPGSGRTQYQGNLFVDGVPLAESPMRDHPLTPMRDSDLVRLLRPQTGRPVGLVRWQDVQRGSDAIAAAVGDGHTLVDALTEADLDAIARAMLQLADERPVVAGGGAGVATALARAAADTSAVAPASALPTVPVTGRLILAGSASAATHGQIGAFPGERLVLDPVELAAGPSALDRLRDALAARTDRLAPILIHASPDVAAAQGELGAERAATLLENALSALAAFAVHELGVSHLLVAGGETSGAVTAGLGIDRLRIGSQAAPGVPWAVADSAGRTVAVLLKSGNFGGPGLFADAWEVAP